MRPTTTAATPDEADSVEVLYSVEPEAWLVWVIVSGFVAVLAGLVAALWALATGTGLATGLVLWAISILTITACWIGGGRCCGPERSRNLLSFWV